MGGDMTLVYFKDAEVCNLCFLCDVDSSTNLLNISYLFFDAWVSSVCYLEYSIIWRTVFIVNLTDAVSFHIEVNPKFELWGFGLQAQLSVNHCLVVSSINLHMVDLSGVSDI